MLGHRTYAQAPDLCAGSGLMHRRRAYTRAGRTVRCGPFFLFRLDNMPQKHLISNGMNTHSTCSSSLSCVPRSAITYQRMQKDLAEFHLYGDTQCSGARNAPESSPMLGHLLSGQLHSVPLHSDSCTRVRLARGRRTYAPASDVCTRAGLVFRRRTYARAPDFGTGAGLMYRRRSCAPAPVLCTGRRTYAEAPDLCRGAGLMRGRRTYA